MSGPRVALGVAWWGGVAAAAESVALALGWRAPLAVLVGTASALAVACVCLTVTLTAVRPRVGGHHRGVVRPRVIPVERRRPAGPPYRGPDRRRPLSLPDPETGDTTDG